MAFRMEAVVFFVAIAFAVLSMVSAQDYEMAPAPAPVVGSAYTPAISGAAICSSLILSVLALIRL